MKKILNLTEDHLKLVKFLNLQNGEIKDDTVSIDKNVLLVLHTHILDDVAMILGLKDKAIEGTENDPDGAAYPDDVEAHMLSVYHYVADNLFDIETILHQNAMEGVKPGRYSRKSNSPMWEFEETEPKE